MSQVNKNKSKQRSCACCNVIAKTMSHTDFYYIYYNNITEREVSSSVLTQKIHHGRQVPPTAMYVHLSICCFVVCLFFVCLKSTLSKTLLVIQNNIYASNRHFYLQRLTRGGLPIERVVPLGIEPRTPCPLPLHYTKGSTILFLCQYFFYRYLYRLWYFMKQTLFSPQCAQIPLWSRSAVGGIVGCAVVSFCPCRYNSSQIYSD